MIEPNIESIARALDALALTIDQHARALRAIEERLGPAVVPRSAHALSSSTVDALRERREVEREPDGYMTAAHRLRLLVLGLGELLNTISYGQKHDATPADILNEVQKRLAQLRDAHNDAINSQAQR